MGTDNSAFIISTYILYDDDEMYMYMYVNTVYMFPAVYLCMYIHTWYMC